MASIKEPLMLNLQNEDFFKDFKYKKSQNKLILNTEFGFNCIEFQYKRTIEKRNGDKSDFGEFAVKIEPIVSVRFNILCKWFEKYSFMTISDQRNNPTIMYYNEEKHKYQEFIFLENLKDFKSDYKNFKEILIEDCNFYFNKYKTVEEYYKYEVFPIFEGKKQLQRHGSDFIFEYLTAVKIVDKSRFEEMVLILKKHIDFMNTYNEPNIEKYTGKIDEIFEHLYHLDL